MVYNGYTLWLWLTVCHGIDGPCYRWLQSTNPSLFSSPIKSSLTGWWYTRVYLPLWKMMEWKSVGMMTFPKYGKMEVMFQTTNQTLTYLQKHSRSACWTTFLEFPRVMFKLRLPFPSLNCSRLKPGRPLSGSKLVEKSRPMLHWSLCTYSPSPATVVSSSFLMTPKQPKKNEVCVFVLQSGSKEARNIMRQHLQDL